MEPTIIYEVYMTIFGREFPAYCATVERAKQLRKEIESPNPYGYKYIRTEKITREVVEIE